MYAKTTGQVRQRRQQPATRWTEDGRDMTAEVRCAPHDELQRLSAQLLEIQENERRRIATDLHDVLGSSLTMIKLGVEESLQLMAANKTGAATESLQQLRLKVQDAFGEVRRVAMDLRPSILDDLGILATLSCFFREFGAACHGVKVKKDFRIAEENVPASLKITIFRIIQEASCNVAKHANASCLKVSLKNTGDTLYLSLEDDGDGFDPLELRKNSWRDNGSGLLSMKERSKLSGGFYTLTSAPGQGTHICVQWQLGSATAA